MNLRLLKLLRIMLNPGITRTPLRVLRELRAQGKRRVPESVDKELSGRGTMRNTLKFANNWLRAENLTRHNGQWVLNSFLPQFPSPAFDQMFENLLSGRRLSPVSAFFAVTADCPFACRHCSAKLRKTGNLSTEQWQKIIGDVQDVGASLIGLTGGEPLLHPGIVELVEGVVARGGSVILFTSGASLDEALAARLKQVGLWAMCVSLDSSDAATVNEFRGSDQAFSTAVEAIRLSRKYGFYTMAGAVGSRSFVESGEYEKLHGFCADLGVQELRIVEPMPCGKMRDADDDSLLAPRHIAKLREFHQAMNRRGAKPKVCAFNQIESPEIFGCGGGTQHLYIDSAGEVCPCDFTPLSFGNAGETPFAEIWEKMTEAMRNPRRHCFLQKHHKLINEYVKKSGQYPLSPELSCELCARTEDEGLSDYFQVVTGQK